MSMLPAAPFRAGNVRSICAIGSSLAFGALSLFITSTAIAAETPATILKKMADVYTKAKTYQASVITLQTSKTPDGKSYTVTETDRVQFKSPNLLHKSVKLTGTGAAATPQGAQQLALRSVEIFSDGKSATMYVPFKKMYQKQPVPPSIQLAQIVALLQAVPPINQPGLTLLPNTANVEGHMAYIIEVKPVPPPNLKAADQQKFQAYLKQFKQYPRLMIDKQNYTLLEYTVTTAAGSAHANLSSQVFGGDIPASAFTFSPPAGVKEFVAPKAPAGGALGAPGGIPGGGGVPGGKPNP